MRTKSDNKRRVKLPKLTMQLNMQVMREILECANYHLNEEGTVSTPLTMDELMAVPFDTLRKYYFASGEIPVNTVIGPALKYRSIKAAKEGAFGV